MKEVGIQVEEYKMYHSWSWEELDKNNLGPGGVKEAIRNAQSKSSGFTSHK